VPHYCPVCRKYSDKFPTLPAMEEHLIGMHPTTEEALLITERRRKGYAQDTGIGKTTQ
jgi:hypothetical protein